MKSAILLAAMLIVAPATAQEAFDETVGAWRVTGDKGDCVALLGKPQGMVMVLSPASGGENSGGLMVTKPGLTDDSARQTFLTMSGPGTLAGASITKPMDESDDPAIYWRPFPDGSAVDAFPDSWRVKLTRDGSTLVDVPATGFAAARTALKRCVAETR